MGTTTLLEISLLHGMFEVSERYTGISGETALPNSLYTFDFELDMYFENPGWGVIDSIKLSIGSDDFGFSSLSLSVMKSETNGYKQLLAVTNIDALINNEQWYHNFGPYCIFEDGRSVLFSDLQCCGAQTIWKLDAPNKYLC